MAYAFFFFFKYFMNNFPNFDWDVTSIEALFVEHRAPCLITLLIDTFAPALISFPSNYTSSEMSKVPPNYQGLGGELFLQFPPIFIDSRNFFSTYSF